MVELFNLFLEGPKRHVLCIKELLFEGVVGKRRIGMNITLRCLKIDMMDNSMNGFRLVFG